MQKAQFANPGGAAVISSQINVEKNFAFLEFRSVDECTRGLAFDGLVYNGQALKLRRPKDYQPVPGMENMGSVNLIPGVVSTQVPDSANKIYIGNLPLSFNADNVKELLTQFGPLKAFHLVTDPATEASKGFAFCEFVNISDGDDTIKGLHGLNLGEKELVVQRASLGARVGTGMATGATGGGLLAPVGQLKSTRVLVLMNMLDLEELKDDESYEDIVEDIREECMKHGKVVSLEIPRPSEGNPNRKSYLILNFKQT